MGKASPPDRELMPSRFSRPEKTRPAIAHRCSGRHGLAHEAEEPLFDARTQRRGGKIGSGEIFRGKPLIAARDIGAEERALGQPWIRLVIDAVGVDELHARAKQLRKTVEHGNLPRRVDPRAAVALHPEVLDAGAYDGERAN